jgi:PIN domain nuclease of toxin-antitoxin system
MRLLDLTPRLVVESTQLLGTCHRDPDAQLMVATARMYHWALMTVDPEMVAYPYVQTLP